MITPGGQVQEMTIYPHSVPSVPSRMAAYPANRSGLAGITLSPCGDRLIGQQMPQRSGWFPSCLFKERWGRRHRRTSALLLYAIIPHRVEHRLGQGLPRVIAEGDAIFFPDPRRYL